VGAAIWILHCVDDLGMPAEEPVGVFKHPAKSSYGFIWDSHHHMTNMLQFGCKLAYPDPSHYLCQHIPHLVSHPNCITAAVCLWLDKRDLDDVAFPLRWNWANIPMYLRECWQDIQLYTLLP
jgi:hypothetical protein